MFAACALRRGYVAGTEQSASAIVKASCFPRRSGGASQRPGFRYRKTWAKGKGCAEFAATADWKTGRAGGLCRVRPLGL